MGVRLTPLQVMLTYYGIAERPGKDSHPVILSWIQLYLPWIKDDGDAAWCSIGMDKVHRLANYERSGKANARSWLDVGEPILWDEAIPGDVIVFWRESPDSWKGHVGLFINEFDADRHLVNVLGANQRNAINISQYRKDRILGIRRPRPLAELS